MIGEKQCPAALRMICCQLLLEITAFLRECPRVFSRRKKKSSIFSSGQFSPNYSTRFSSSRTASSRSGRDGDRFFVRRPSHSPGVQSGRQATSGMH